MYLTSGATTANYLDLAQYGTEYTQHAGFAGNSAVTAAGSGNLILRSANSGTNISLMPAGLSSKVIFYSDYSAFSNPIIFDDAGIKIGNTLTVTGLVIDSTKWYRVLQLGNTYCQWAELIIKIPLGHSVYKFRLSKATYNSGIGWNVQYDLGGIYNYTTRKYQPVPSRRYGRQQLHLPRCQI